MDVDVDIGWKVASHAVQQGLDALKNVRNIVAVASGKGGVGKSTVAANLALALSAEGAKVGVLDADIYGPSQPRMLGAQGQPDSRDGKSLEPMTTYRIQSMSIGYLIEEDTPMIWRGPMVTQALEQLLRDTNWRDLDYLVVDLPPGTGDIQLTLAQRIPVSGAIIVTTPQDIALLDARKGLAMFEKVKVPVLGLLENMSTYVCSQCGHEDHIFGEGGGRRMAEGARRGPARRHPSHPGDSRGCRQWTADGHQGSGRSGGPALPRDRTAGRGETVAEGEGLQSGVPENRHPVAGTRGDATATGNSRAAPRSGPGMSIKSDRWIHAMAESHGMIEPFVPGQVRERDGGRVISFGTSSYGYDIRCANEFKIFTNINSAVVDPKNFDDSSFVDLQADVCIIPPNSFALARTVEYLRIPRNILTICLGKSTYARCGIIVNVTPLEPEWEGHVTLEFSNTTPLPAKIYANEGVAQVLFFESDEVCEVSYRDRAGKYMRQRGVTLPKA